MAKVTISEKYFLELVNKKSKEIENQSLTIYQNTRLSNQIKNSGRILKLSLTTVHGMMNWLV